MGHTYTRNSQGRIAKRAKDSTYSGPELIKQLLKLDRENSYLTDRTYSDPSSDLPTNEALIRLYLDELRIAGHEKEAQIIEDVRNKKRKKDKAYFKALSIINKIKK